MFKLKLLFTLIFLSFFNTAFAAETDNYTNRNFLKKHATPIINTRFRNALENSVRHLKKEGIECPRNLTEALDIYDFIQPFLHNPFKAHKIANYYHDNLPNNVKIDTELEDSIYRDLTITEGISLNIKGLVSTMLIRGRDDQFHHVGTDKLDHFLIEGWLYYEKAYLEEGELLEDALEWGRFTEETYYGKTTTGVFSHADLSANFNGMRFWNHLLGFFMDPLDDSFHRGNAFLQCRRGIWKVNPERIFRIEDYVDSSWDEAINCNEYDTFEILTKVSKRVGLLKNVDEILEDEMRFCPLKLAECDKLVAHYGRYSELMLTPLCQGDTAFHEVIRKPTNQVAFTPESAELANEFLYNYKQYLKKYGLENDSLSKPSPDISNVRIDKELLDLSKHYSPSQTN